MELNIPGRGTVEVRYLAIDLNGTLAIDGRLVDSVYSRLAQLLQEYEIYVVSANTHGNLLQLFDGLGVHCVETSSDDCTHDKANLVQRLGTDFTVAIGNGASDEVMLRESVIGIAVVGEEGCATSALLASDLVVRHIDDALDCILNPKRLLASLRQ